MVSQKWGPVTKSGLAGFLVGLSIFLFLVFRCEPGFIFLLDHTNLLFHEAGHPAVGIFSRRLETYGGTLGQLVFPCVLVVSFWRKGQPIGVAAGVIWFFENWLNIARYMADARTMELPLVGGGDHDWHTILSRWGLLAYDIRIASVLRMTAWAGIATASVWILWRAWLDRRRRQEEQHTSLLDPHRSNPSW